MTAFWMGHRMLGDVLGFCAAAHLFSLKIGTPVKVWFDPARTAACEFFDGVVWTPHEEIPDAVDCGITPTAAEWPQLNGVKRFYRFMDSSMSPPKSFDIHFNRPRNTIASGLAKRRIGLITHSHTQGAIHPESLTEILEEARCQYPTHQIGCIGGMDNDIVPAGVEDWRQRAYDIHHFIELVASLDLLISPQSGPCFAAAGWRIPMWVYRSSDATWDFSLNFDEHKVSKWWDRRAAIIKPPTPLYVNWKYGLGDAILHISLYYHYAKHMQNKLYFYGNSELIDRKMREFVKLARLEQPDIDLWIEQIPVGQIRHNDDGQENFTGWIPIASDNCVPEHWCDFECYNFISCFVKVMKFGNRDRPADGLDFPHDYLHYPCRNAGSNRVVFHLIGASAGSYADSYDISRSDIITLIERLRSQGYIIVFLQPYDSWMTQTFPWATFHNHENDMQALFDEVSYSRAVFAVDSGVAHVALCCGVPLYLFKKESVDGLGFHSADAELITAETMLSRDFVPNRIVPRIPQWGGKKFYKGHSDAESLLQLLMPKALPGDEIHPQLLRLGRNGDGGYLVPRDPGDSASPRLHAALKVPLLSFGIGWDVSFEMDWARMTRQPVVCYDHTITPEQWNRLISGYGKSEIGLFHHISKPAMLSRGRPSRKVIEHFKQQSQWALKMDIEGSEYHILEQHGELMSSAPSGLVLIVMELHWLSSTASYMRAIGLLNMLHKNWLLVHAHANNYGSFWRDWQGNVMPEVVELTWLHRSLLPPNWRDQQSSHRRPLPGLDFPNNGDRS